ncbi:chemotaxis protein CheW [Sphingomonas montana]|uniref:chemotaxis protein CheW n=1 Tax=Sphingomonas montana TaxID=1843236 RepID=UPI00096C8E3A|nr:chemotaxis protein CheW [Sphingomonas montana]
MTGDVRVTAADRSDDAIAGELERRRRAVAHVAGADVATGAMLCWVLGGTRFAAPLAAIRHVADAVAATPLPGAPAAVIGVFARRGVIHTLFDPAAVLGVERGGGPGTVLLLQHDRPFVAIRVDAVQDVVQLPTAEMAAAMRGGGIAHMMVQADDLPITIVDMGRLIGHLTGRNSPTREEG